MAPDSFISVFALMFALPGSSLFLVTWLVSFYTKRMLWKADPAFPSFFSFNRFLILLHDSERVTFAQSLISRNIPADSAITLRNIQSANVILGILGPNSRQLLQSLTQTSMDVNQFPANSAKVNVIHAGVSYTA